MRASGQAPGVDRDARGPVWHTARGADRAETRVSARSALTGATTPDAAHSGGSSPYVSATSTPTLLLRRFQM